MDFNQLVPDDTPFVADAIHQQESDGVPHDYQIQPGTFKQYAQPGESFNNPQDHDAVYQRIISDLNDKANGDPARIAVGYFSGPGNIAPPDNPTPYKSDKKDNNGKSTSSYVSDVLGRLPGQVTQNGQIMNDASSTPDFSHLVPDDETSQSTPLIQKAPSNLYSPFSIANSAVRAGLNIMKTARDIPSQMLGGANDLVDLVTNNTGDATAKAQADFNEKYQKGQATSADYKKLFLAGEADNPGGKFLGATRMFPPFAIGASALENLINPELENAAAKVGMDKEDVPLAENALMLIGGKAGEKNLAPNFMNNAVSKVSAAAKDFAGKPIAENPSLPVGMDKMPDSGKSLLVSNSGVREGMNAFKQFQDTDGIDLNKTADTLEEMQKTNPDARAIDAMTKTEGDIPTGANITGLAKSIASSPGQGRTMIAEMSGRGHQAPDRIGTMFDNTISNLPYSKVQADAVQAREGTAPLYQQAFQANKNMMSPKINQLLNRPAGQAALQKAATTMQNDGALVGVSDPDLVEQAALTGQPPTEVGIANGLKMQTLHYVKKALFDMGNSPSSYNQFGQRNADGAAYMGMYHDLLGEMNANDATRQPNQPNSGLYAQANQRYSTGARQQQALQQGMQFHTMRPDDISTYLNDKAISDPEKAAFLSGVRERLQTVADRKNPGQNPISSLSKVDMQKRYQAIVGNKAPALLTGMENEAHMAKNDNLLAGSQTYSNEAFSNKQGYPHTLPGRIAGEIPGVGGMIGYGIDKALAKRTTKMSADSKAVVARVLTSKDPAELRALANKQGSPNR